MPNRIVREDILTSDRVDALSPGAEVFYRRLMSVADDFGRFDARPIMLRGSCYPLRLDKVTDRDVLGWLAECEKAGLVVVYTVGGKQCLEIQRFGQRTRAQTSRYPAPMTDRCQTDDGHPSDTRHTSAHVVVVGDGDGNTCAESPNFGRFWDAYPLRRRVDRKACLALWQRKKLDREHLRIMAGLQAWKHCKDWTKDGGDFVPAPLVWLRNERWKEAPIVADRRPDGSIKVAL